jgi:tetratricopeptide (TPR) repeat protein
MRHLLTPLLGLFAFSLHAADLSQARQLMMARRVPEARPLLEGAVKEEPSNVDALLMLGQCQMDMQDLVPAVETLAKAAELAPTRTDVLVSYGGVCLQQAAVARSLGLTKKGRAALESALEIDPALIDARQILISYYSNAPWFAGGDMDKAYAHAKALRTSAPDQGLIAMLNLKSKDKHYSEVFALCDEELARNPENYAVLYEFGRAVSLSGERRDEGIAALQKCVTLTQPPHAPGKGGAFYRMGLIYQKSNKPEEARRCFEEAMKVEPANQALMDQVKKAKAALG